MTAKSKVSRCRGSDRGLEPLRAQPFFRAGEIGPQDVGELDDERVDLVPESAGLAVVHRLPDVTNEAERHGLVAVDDFAVGLEGGANALQAVAEQLVVLRRQPARGDVEEIRQRLRSALHDQRADLPFEPQGMLPQPLAVGASGDLLQDVVDQAAERLHRRLALGVAHQHQRKIVAKRAEIAIFGEQRWTQVDLVGRVGLAARPLPDHMKGDMRLKFRSHARSSWLACRRFVLGPFTPQAAGSGRSLGSCGQTVNLSNSASRPALIIVVERVCPALRRSS